MTINEFWTFVSSLEKRYAEFRSELMESYSLTAAEADVLLFLCNNPERDTASQISKTRKIAKSHVSLAVNSLISRHFIEPCYLEGDRRSAHLRLTGEAAGSVKFGREMQEKFAALLFDGFADSERAEFSRLCRKIAKNMEDSKC